MELQIVFFKLQIVVLKNNQLRIGEIDSALRWAASHHPVVDYFPIRATPGGVFFLT